MQTGYYSAAGGMVTQFNRLNNISNNLANVNTVGFKQDNVVVGDFERLYQEARDELPLKNQTVEGAKFIHRAMAKVPQIVDSYTDFTLGNVQETGNKLDFALSKPELFFAVETDEGVRLTRDGSFTLDDEGFLVNKQGNKVLPSDYMETKGYIKFDPQDTIVEVDKN